MATILMAAIVRPGDKMEFLLTMPEEDRKDWLKPKKAILTEYRADAASCEQASLARMRVWSVSLSLYILQFWSVCTVKRLKLKKKQLSPSHHKRKLRVSFFAVYLNRYLLNYSWITPTNRTQTLPSKLAVSKKC